MSIVWTKIKSGLKTIFVEKKTPWKIQRLWILIRANNIRILVTKTRFFFKKPKYKIILSSHYLGGVGGTEKLVKSVIESMPETEFHIMSDDIRFLGFYPKTYNYYVNITPKKNAKYDAYLYFCGGGRPCYLGTSFKFRKLLVDTNAARIHDIENLFDHVLIQSTIWQNFTREKEKCVTAFPLVKQTIPKKRTKVKDLPGKFLLTVFNPFSPKQKGQSVLYENAPKSKLPIVWCFSDVSGWDFDSLPKVPNVIYLRNLTQEELYFVYERATAYISFAFYESYGWTLAEAFSLGLPIISRPTGIIPYIKDQKGILTYENEIELTSILQCDDFLKPNYNEDFFIKNSYPAAIERLITED